VFSVTLSVNARLRECCPRILRGMLPYGVRTFLQQALRLTSDHLPSTQNLAQKELSGSQENQEKKRTEEDSWLPDSEWRWHVH
jgi:hypothetical protein